jgi:predicted AAA+ superfamily ATPase
MIHRTIQDKIVQMSQKLPVITITGPRQSGKTTLAKHLFPHHSYVNLELSDKRDLATTDPRGFFALHSSDLILDEVQRAPHLLSYIQGIVDERKQNGQFVLTGSENLLLSEKVNQSLAGRTYIATLLPLSLEELQDIPISFSSYVPYLQRGFYPRLYDSDLATSEWLPSYIQTYVEKDIRQLINIRNLKQFQTFLKLCAGHIGQIINYTAFSNTVGVSDKTIKEWLSILEATYIAFTLPPYYNNFKKRLIKSLKLYFYDTGLACTLLGINDEKSLIWHPLQGSLFENFIIVELLKRHFNRGLWPQFYFWRDNSGTEVDCLIEGGGKVLAIEIKSTQTLTSFPTSNLKNLTTLMSNNRVEPYIVYGGEQSFNNQGIKVLSWKNLDILLKVSATSV